MAERIVMFGKSYVPVGEQETHLVLRTAGDIQVKTKDRFITIFKNGKLNVSDSTEIFSVGSVEDIKKNGVYLVGSTDESGKESQDVYLAVDGVKILLASSNEGFVSYSAIQELTAENFIQAAKNIGLYFETMDEAKAAGIVTGMVYILADQKLYKVVNGEFTDINASTAYDDSTGQDSQTEEPEKIDSLKIAAIFIDGTSGIISGEGQIIVQVDGNEYVKYGATIISPKQDIVLDPTRKVYFKGGTQKTSGFWLYTEDGESFLEIDNLIVHNSQDSYTPKLYSTYIGCKVKSLISKAEWETSPTDIKLTLKYPAEFQVGDSIMIQTAGGNQATIEYREDEGETSSTKLIGVTLETPPSSTTTLKVTYAYAINDEGDTAEATVNVVIDPNDLPEGELDDTTGNQYGEATVSQTVDHIVSIEIVSGDSDVYFIDEDGIQHGGNSLPMAMTGTVTNAAPLTINVPSQKDAANSVLKNLENSTIYRLAPNGSSETILWHEEENTTLYECSQDGGTLKKEPITRLGNLSDIPDPATPANNLEGYGIYGKEPVFEKAKMYGAIFEGNSEDWYPKYGDHLLLPADVESDTYNNIVPTIGWVKKLTEKAVEKAIQKFIDENLPGIVEEAVNAALEAASPSE